MKKPPHKGIARLLAAWRNSKAGLRDLWRREEAFRQETVTFAVGIPLAFWIGGTTAQTALMIGSILLLMIVEILNSAIEAIVDRIGPEHHELSRIAKDLGSAAVLLTALFPVGVWGIVILSRLGLITL